MVYLLRSHFGLRHSLPQLPGWLTAKGSQLCFFLGIALCQGKQPCPLPRGSLSLKMGSCRDTETPLLASICGNSEGPSQLQTSQWDQLRPLLQLHHSSSLPWPNPAILTSLQMFSSSFPSEATARKSLSQSLMMSQGNLT